MSTVDASKPDRLGLPDDGAGDETAAQTVATAIGLALDSWLTSAQLGQPDLAVIGGEWAAETADGVLLAGVANPDNPVTAATYDVQVHMDPAPSIAGVVATITRDDESVAHLEFVFDVSEGAPRLQLVQGLEGQA